MKVMSACRNMARSFSRTLSFTQGLSKAFITASLASRSFMLSWCETGFI